MQAAIRARFLNDDVFHVPARRDPRAVMDRIRARVLGQDQVDREVFYDPDRLAILPMGLCYPGAGKSGDLPPCPKCAPQWRRVLLDLLPNIELTLVVGQYAQAHQLPDNPHKDLTETVRAWKDFWPHALPLPRPSPRNNIWMRKNPCFEADVLPTLRDAVNRVLSDAG